MQGLVYATLCDGPHPQVVVAGVMPSPTSKDERGKVPRAWIVLSDEGKKLGVEAVIKKLEAWYQKALSDHKWLHGGIETVNEVCMAIEFLSKLIL